MGVNLGVDLIRQVVPGVLGDLAVLEYEHAHLHYRWKVARGPWLWLLDRLDFAALTMPWRTIYMHPDWWFDIEVRRHELVHIAQIQRDGAIPFSIRYLWQVARHGYWNAPYEVEARNKVIQQ